MLALLVRSIVFLALLALLGRLYASKGPRDALAEAAESMQRGASRVVAAAAEDSATRIAVLAGACAVAGMLLGGAAVQSAGVMVIVYVLLALLGGLLAVDFFSGEHPQTSAGVSEGRDYDEVVRMRNRTRKSESRHFDVCDHITGQWSLRREVAVECNSIVELVLRDFIHPWYDWMSDDTDFIRDIQEAIADALGMLLSQLKERVHPIMFVFDTICDAITRQFQVYRTVLLDVRQDAEMRQILRDSHQGTVSLADWNRLQARIAEEFRRRGRLHPMLIWDGSEVEGGDQSSTSQSGDRPVMADHLSVEEFQDPERIKQCERSYLRFVSSRIIRKLLVNKENLNSKPIRHLVREIFANTILLPVASLFVPSTINWWIDMALVQMNAADVQSAGEQEPKAAAAADEEPPEIAARHFDSICPVGKAPKGFDPSDSAWRFCAGSIGTEEATLLLKGEPAGSFLIRKSQEDHSPSAFVLSVVVPVAAGSDTSPVNKLSDGGAANFSLDDARPSMVAFPTGGEVEVRHIRIACTPSSFSVVDKDKMFECVKLPGLIHNTVTNPSTSLTNLITGLKPVLLKGVDVVQLAVEGGGVVNPDLIPTTPVARKAPRQEDANPSAQGNVLVATAAAVELFEQSSDPIPVAAELAADNFGQPASDADTAVLSVASPTKPSPVLDRAFMAEQQRNVMLLELSAAVDELNDYVTYARQHMGVTSAQEDEFIVYPPIPVVDAGGVEAVARVLQAVDHILRHGMIVTRSATQSGDAAAPRLNSFTHSVDGQPTQHSRKHSESEGSVQLHFNPSQAGLISDYFQDAAAADNATTATAADDETQRDSATSVGILNDFEADRTYTGVILANFIYTCRDKLGDLETPDAETVQAAWMWLVHNRRTMFDYGEGARLLDIDASKQKSLADMSRITGGRINMLLWLSLGRLAEGIRLLARNETVLQGVYDESALMRVRGDRRKMLDALEIVAAQQFTLQGSAADAGSRDKRNFLGRAVSRVFSTRKSESGENSPVNEPKKLSRRPSWRSTLSARLESRTLESVDEDGTSKSDGAAEEPKSTLTTVLAKPMNALKNNFRREDSDRPPGLERQPSQTMKALLDNIVSMPASVLDGMHQEMIPRHLNFAENTKFIDKHRRRLAAATARWSQKRGEGWRKDARSPQGPPPTVITSQLEGFVRSVTGESIPLDTRDAAPGRDAFDSNVGKPHAFKLQENFARAAWILSNMLRDREDLSQLKRKGVWADPSMRLPMSARITSAHTEAIPSQKVPGTKSTVTLYCAHVATPGGKEWTVARRYNDFDALHRHLRSQVGPNVVLPTLPPKNRLGFGSTDNAFIENRRVCLEKYLCELLSHPAFSNCFELFVFLRPDVTSAVAAMIDQTNSAGVSQGPKDSQLLSDAYMQTLVPKQDSEAEGDDADDAQLFMVRNLDDPIESELYVRASIADGRSAVYEPAAEKGDVLRTVDRADDFDADIPDTPVKLVDADMMRRIEARVYTLLREVLEMDRMNIVRRQVLALLRRALRMFFTSSMAEWLSSKYQLYRRDAYISMLIQFIRETVWPNGILIQPGVYPTDEEDHAKRQQLQQVLKKVIPATLDPLIGRDQSEKGMIRVYHMLQNWVLLKSLFFIILDLVLIELLPDLAEVLDGADCLR